MLQLPVPARSSRSRSQLIGSVAGLAAFLALSGKAHARTSGEETEGLVALADMPNVASVELREDGSVLVRFDDGSARLLAPGDVIVENGVVYLDPAAHNEMALGEGSDILLIGLGVVAVGGALALLAGGEENVAPVITSAATVSVSENTAATGLTVTANDANRDPVTFSIVGGADAARFAIDSATGALRFVAAPDFETPGDANRDNVFEVDVAASDGTLQATQTIRVTVTNLNDNAPVITSAGAVTINENVTAVAQVAATDADGNALTFSLSGADAALFAINSATGAITFIAGPDFENPRDADRNNVYQLTVTASDGTNSTTQNLAVTVVNVNDIAPVITSGAAVSVRENGTAVTQVVASDAEGNAITFSLSGADAARFAINATSGIITFIAAPDFENPGDADRNNAYQITVTANDGVNNTTQNLTITVTDQNEVVGTDGNDILNGSAGDDVINGRGGNDRIDGLAGTDTLTGGVGADDFVFDLATVNDGLTEDSITDFSFTDDRFVLNAASFGVAGPVRFAAVNANAMGATIPAGTNVIVLLNSDNDGNPATAFNARSAATQIAGLVGSDAPGFFVYFNSGLGVNRLVFSSNLNDPNAPLQIIARLTDLTGQAAIDALARFAADDFAFDPLLVLGTDGNDTLTGSAGTDVIDGRAGDDVIDSLAGTDTVTGGAGADDFVFSRATVADGLNEDSISDFAFAEDDFVLDAASFGVAGAVSFVSLDGNAMGATIASGANVIVLRNADNDGNPATAFNARSAATQIAGLTDGDRPGFFVYFNSGLQVNRLVFSENLNDPNAALQVVARLTDLTGQAAIDALARFTADNFVFTPLLVLGTDGNDTLTGSAGTDVIDGRAGDDVIDSLAGTDTVTGGAGADDFVFSRATVADGLNEDSISDFSFDVPTTTIIVNQAATTLAVVDAALAGNIYFNIHSTTFPAGEVRGQLVLAEDNRSPAGVGSVTFTAVLNGENEVQTPPVVTDAQGTGTVTFTIAADGTVTYSTTIELTDFDVTTLTVGHFHQAPAGQNGPVVVDLLDDARDDGLIEGNLIEGDNFVLDAASFGVAGAVSFVSLDGNAMGATIASGANVIVLRNADNDGNPATAFNARSAATQIAGLTDGDRPGFFVYFNSGLQVNRLVFSENLNDPNAALQVVARLTDLTGQAAIDALAEFSAGNFAFLGTTLTGTDEIDTLSGFGGDDTIIGLAGNDMLDGRGGDDRIEGGAGTDTLTGGNGADELVFDLATVNDGLTEDSITDFSFAEDRFVLDSASFDVPGPLAFIALDGNTAAANAAAGSNVIVLLNSDDDANPATAFNARSAARQIDDLVDSDGPGFFVYFNSSLGVNRLVYSENLNDGEAPLQIVARLTDLTGQAAIDALAQFSEANFVFEGEAPAVTMLTQGDLTSLPGEVNMALFAAEPSGDGAIVGLAPDLTTDPLDEKELAAVAQVNADALAGGL